MGIEYRAIDCHDGPDIDLHVVRIDLASWRPNAANGAPASAREIAAKTASLFVINANFFDAGQRPLGAIVRSGLVIQRPRDTRWQTIFAVGDDGRAHIVRPSAFESIATRTWMAVQAGPALVIGGEMVMSLKPGRPAARAGVCIAQNADLLFFATPRSRRFDVHDIARIVKTRVDEGGLACRDAMLFDGGGSVNFLVDGDSDVSVAGERVPAFVYLEPSPGRAR